MTDSARLERGYRHLLAGYPAAFRREHEDEMLAVLMAGAPEGRRRPGLAESADLIKGATKMRLRPDRPGSPRSMRAAVRLMYVGAAVELGVLVTVVATVGDLKSAIVRRNPGYTAAQWHTEVAHHIVAIEIGAPIAICLWLFMAWANRRGFRWARFVFAAFFGLTTLSLFSGLAQGAVIYAPADVIAGAVLWLVSLAALVLIFNAQSSAYYRRAPVSHA